MDSTNLSCGSTIDFQPTDFIINVSCPVDPATVHTSSFMVNNIQPNSFMLTNNNFQITFHFNSSPVVQGLNTMHIPAGGFTCCGGPVLEFICTFLYEAPTPTPTPTATATATFTPTTTPTPTATATATGLDHDSYCNSYSHSYTQANAYTKSCSDAAAAAHRATAPDTRARRTGEHRLLPCSRRQPADEQFQGRGRAKAGNVRRAFRQAAEKNRLAACAPRRRDRSFLVIPQSRHEDQTLAWRAAQKNYCPFVCTWRAVAGGLSRSSLFRRIRTP